MRLLVSLRLPEILQITFIGVFGCIVTQNFVFESGPILYLSSLALHVAGTYLINDFYDFAADLTNPRRANKKSISSITLRNLSYAAFFGSQICAFLFSPALGALMTVLNLIGVTYSVPPARFKARKPMPAILHAIVGAAYFLGACLISKADFRSSMVIYSIFWATALASASFVNEVIDRDVDRSFGIKTLGQTLFLKANLILFSAHGLMTALLLTALAIDGLIFSFVVGLVLAAIYFSFWWLRPQPATDTVRLRYRIFFAILTLVPCAEFIKPL